MYHLEKYRNISQKHLCPKCEKRTFVQYVDEQGRFLAYNVGRCDKEDSCGYHYTPKDYFIDNPTGKTEWKPNYQKPIKEVAKPIDYIPFKYIEQSCTIRNSNFVYFLFYLFDWHTIKQTIDQYFIGCTKDKAVIFPQIDEKGKVRTAKIQQYNPETGKRIKDQKGAINWVHSILKNKGALSKDFNLQMCLFGLHLIRSESNKNKGICIVESEKTAVIASGALPEYIWMASGALGWLNIEKLKPLKDRSIVLYPDASRDGKAFNKWSNIAKEAKEQGLNVSVSTFLENICTIEQKEQGYDLGDYLIEKLIVEVKEAPKKQLTESEKRLIEMQRMNPALKLLIEKFDLQLC